MTDARDAKGEDSGHSYVRLPWPLVAAGLFGLLILVLAAGLFANRYLRPQIGLVPTAVPLAAPTAGVPTPFPATAVAATAAEAGTPLIIGTVAARTATPPLVPAAAPTSTPAPPALASATPSPLPTVEPALAEEVGKAYEMFWRVRSQALLELDATHLAETMDGDYLTNFTQGIDQLRSEGRAIKTKVSLHYFVFQASADAASIVDDLEDNSVYVTVGTEDALSNPTGDQQRVLYRLRKVEGAWKVVGSVRSE
jgi:hypothetical protein